METSNTDQSRDHSSQEQPLNDANATVEAVAELSAASDNYIQTSSEGLGYEEAMPLPRIESTAQSVDSVSTLDSLAVSGEVHVEFSGATSLANPGAATYPLGSYQGHIYEQVTNHENEPIQENDDNIDAKIVCSPKGVQRKKKKIIPILEVLKEPIEDKSQIRRVPAKTKHSDTIISVNVRQFDEFNDISKIGEGHYGQVYEFKVMGLPNNRMAVKCNQNKKDSSGRWPAKDEVEIMELVCSKNIQHVVDFYCYVTDVNVDRIYICMEWMDTSMDKFYRAMHQSLDEVVDNQLDAMIRYTAYSVLSALRYLNEKGIVHRDIKPANMLINKDGIIKLCDFGISAYLNKATDYAVVEGTVKYLAPHRRPCAIELDMWALAMSLLEIVNGEHPLIDWSEHDVFFRIPQWQPVIPHTISEEMREFITDLFENGRGETPCSYDDILKSSAISNMSSTRSNDLFIFIRETFQKISSTDSSNECNDVIK